MRKNQFDRFGKCKAVISAALAGMITLLSFTGDGAMAVYAETTSEKIQKAEELKKITEEQRQTIEDKKDDLVEQKAELQGYLSTLNGELQEISNNLAQLEETISEKEQEIEEARQAIEEAKADEEKQYSLMKMRIKHIYERGGESFLSRFLGAKSYSDFLNRAEYVNKMEAYDQKLFEDMTALRERIEETEEVLQRELTELTVLREQSEEEHQKVDALVSTTSGSLAATSGAISAAEMEQAAYEAELKSQEENLEALKKQLAEEQAMAAKAAKMAWRDISEVHFEEGDRDLLAALIYCEAGSEPYVGQVAVGAVVINRIRSAAYPGSMVGVIYQNGQFSPVASGRLATRLSLGANESCYRAADEAMAGSTPVGNCLYFRTVIPEINGQIIGGHVFY
ncbi:MAG: cell wall hydrolase [Lachnospiraceae bacterium]|nr:cell wall hydrolase [Lachnospiraceae bacterium]